MRRIKIKAKMLEDADVQYVSLVDRPANRIPFRVLKVDRTTSENPMIELGKAFFGRRTKSEDVLTERPELVGVVVRKSAVEAMSETLQDAGIDLATGVEDGETVVYKISDEEGVGVALSEDLMVFLSDAEMVQKAFSSYSEGTDFAENLKVEGLLPGIGMSTEVLMGTMHKALNSSKDRADAVQKLRGALDSYSKHVMSLIKSLPDTVFKMEAQLWADPAAPEAAVAKTEKVAVNEENDAATPEAQATEEVTQKSASEPVAEVVDGGQEVTDASAEVVAEEVSADESRTVEVKVDATETPDFSAILAAALGPLGEAVSKLAESVNGIAEKQTALEASVAETAKKADDVAKAVRGTVMSGGDEDTSYETLGTMNPETRKKGEGDRFWSGTALDKIIG